MFDAVTRSRVRPLRFRSWEAPPNFSYRLKIMPHAVQLYKKYSKKSVVRIWVGPQPWFLLGGAESAEVVLSSNKIIDKGPEYDYIQPWLATGLLTSTGAKWHQRRKLLTPTFHFQILEGFVHVINEQSAVLIDKLSEKVDQNFDIYPFIALCTLDIICETAMGRHVDAQQKSDSDYVKAVYKMTHIIQARQTRPWLQPDWLFRLFPLGSEQKKCLSILHGFTDQVIRERKNEHKLRKTEQQPPVDSPKKDDDEFISKKSRLAFLDLLIEASQDGKVLSDLDIREEVDTFMVEGHDTTASAINWCLFLIGNYPEVQEKVNEELTRVFGNSNRPVTMTDLSELKYLECCIKEALRLYPSVPILSRQLLEDTIICMRIKNKLTKLLQMYSFSIFLLNPGGYDLPVGATVIVSPYLIHRDPTYFPDPESFKPERFFPENIQGRHPYAYVPFSAGPRNCIGQKFAMMEEKIILASVLRRFHVKSLDKPENVAILTEVILRPLDGIRMLLTTNNFQWMCSSSWSSQQMRFSSVFRREGLSTAVLNHKAVGPLQLYCVLHNWFHCAKKRKRGAGINFAIIYKCHGRFLVLIRSIKCSGIGILSSLHD
ncbi:cytochrome P450 4C1-like isoform X3 [Daphnia pulex]|uniref:cytochrome P450 4C1-like isoform X3 n=1 Tax=Daphnia pulex TaxID=6669 RepID=UPI001EDDE763|nr:cytochrome P450 4C1-like isoform X3 [Daphnia pulex]